MQNLDIIIPVKNEEKNIKPLIGRLHKALSKAKILYHLIFVDDHSSDKTVEVLKKYQRKYKIKIFSKQDKPGKAYSILEGARYTTSQNIAMLDADLQYPPEVIPEMLQKLIKGNYGVVVAKRKNFHTSLIRKFISLGFKYFFGKFLFNLNVDVQSGLKVFKKEIIGYIKKAEVSKWTLDLPLLYTARDLGYKIAEVEIDFDKRSFGKSHVNLINQIFEIGCSALKLKLKNRKVFILPPTQTKTMLGSGLAYKGKRFITHTTLSSKVSAFKTLTNDQKFTIFFIIFLSLIGFFINSFLCLSVFIATISAIYFVDVFFNLYLILKSLNSPPEIHISDKEILELKSKDLPVYSILCPLYKEAQVVPHFIESIKKLDYPKNKLDVQLLLEEDDVETIEAIKKLKLPPFIKITVVPDSSPKTKPKACNFGLNLAKGEYLVVYDVEDQPEKDQLKKAYLAFSKVKPSVACLQAKLNYYNPHQNLLTRFFTAEYSLWFEIMLPAMQAIETNIPLGGTSNHFRTKTLLALKGWDSFNVTEDCDLGVRLFIEGKTTEIINSYTLEEANSSLPNWIRQRSRWIKGYMQTLLVHSRNPIKLYKKEGIHALIFHLTIGAKIFFLFINPILWMATFSYFAFNAIVGSTIESLYSPSIFYMAVISAVLGNFLYLYYYMIGCAKKGHYSLIKFIFLIPLYWFFGSIAAFIALYQLIFKPHYWEKTVHGLNLKKVNIQPAIAFNLPIFGQQMVFGGVLLILATMVTNISNLFFNTFLARNLSLERYGEVTLFVSLLSILLIPISALSTTITQKCASLFGKYSKGYAKRYVNTMFSKTFLTASVVTLFWVLMIPFLKDFFHTKDYLPFIIFSPVWIISLISANFGGYLKGTFGFIELAFITILESVCKLSAVILLVERGFSYLVLLSIPLSLLVTSILSWFFVFSGKAEAVGKKDSGFNKKFFIASFLSGITNISFLGLDVLLVKHFLTPTEAGQYGLLSLSGKVIFFSGSLVAMFILPVIAKNHAAKQKTDHIFYKIFTLSAVATIIPALALAVFGPVLIPLFFGAKGISILPYLSRYALTISLFSIAQPIIYYFQAKENYYFVIVSFIISIFQVFLLSVLHTNLGEVVRVMFAVSFLNILSLALLFLCQSKLFIVTNVLKDFADLILTPFKSQKYGSLKEKDRQYLRILVFNWRDIKHKWAGGAEVYIHQLAKNWVSQGHQVTIFCGNDGENPNSEFIDGVRIVRRGGFYMVYIWAIFYYLLKLRGSFDVVIDSANGIPFFTPLFISKPKFLLIHHIHQDVFREHLIKPLAVFATFLETKLTPFIYRDEKVITVSESSKNEIIKLSGSRFSSIDIIYPGVELETFKKLKKTKDPSLLYLGRLKPYKNVDIVIKAFSKITHLHPKAKLTIAGFGESLEDLKHLADSLQLGERISFLGKVSEEKKIRLLSTNWIFLQPSMVEGWGITVIEANASFTPVIASNVNGLRDSIVDGSTGILVKPKSIDGFALAIDHLISHPKLRETISKNAYSWAQKFSWNESHKKFLQLIESEGRVYKAVRLRLAEES